MKKTIAIVFFLIVACWCLPQVSTADQVYFYHNDPAGTPLAMTDASGTVVWKADYKPFGEEHSTTGAAANDRRFVGKEKDEETGFSYFGARYEDAKTGRFIAPDPVRAVDANSSKTNEKMLLDPQRLNTYAYSVNNPYRYVDPDGNTPWDIVDFGFFAHSVYKFGQEPSWSNAGDLGLNTLGLLPIVPSIGVVKVVGEGAIDAVNAGRRGKQAKLRELVNDDKASSPVRGWVKQEINSIERGQRNSIRNPPGKDLAHERGREAAKGYGYDYSNLQDRDLHKLQHRYDNFGRKNKERNP